MSVVLIKDYNFMFNGEELTGTKEYLTLYTWCRLNIVVITGVVCIEAFRREVPILRVRFTLLSWKWRNSFLPNAGIFIL